MKLAFPMPHLIRLKATMQPWEARVTGADQTRLAKLADRLGYDMLSVPEHFLMPAEHVELSGPHHFHAAAGQGYFAGATERIKVNSSIAILPLQHPAVTAKALATIDWMSGGRIIATFGAGWLKREFEILGVPFAERGRMCDEYLAAIIELWTKDEPAFEGCYVSFRDVAFEPKPVSRPHVPIWLGGDADAVLARAARFASGWWPFLTRPEDLPARIDYLKSQPGYDGRPFEIMMGYGTTVIGEGHVVLDDPNLDLAADAQVIVDRLGWFRDLGVTMSSVPIPPAITSIEAFEEYVAWVVEDVRPKLG